MPVSFNSPPRNFFLLGSGAQQALTNFFETVPRYTGTDRFSVSDIAYSETDQKYILSGSGKDSNSVSFGWLEKQDYDEATTTNVEAWRQIFESTLSPKKDVTLNFMKQTDSYGGDIVIGGKVNNIPWVAKYRPKSVYDVACQHNITQVLKKTITTKQLPNLLLYGPSGTGKTSTILAIARALFGPDLIN